MKMEAINSLIRREPGFFVPPLHFDVKHLKALNIDWEQCYGPDDSIPSDNTPTREPDSRLPMCIKRLVEISFGSEKKVDSVRFVLRGQFRWLPHITTLPFPYGLRNRKAQAPRSLPFPCLLQREPEGEAQRKYRPVMAYIDWGDIKDYRKSFFARRNRRPRTPLAPHMIAEVDEAEEESEEEVDEAEEESEEEVDEAEEESEEEVEEVEEKGLEEVEEAKDRVPPTVLLIALAAEIWRTGKQGIVHKANSEIIVSCSVYSPPVL